MSATTLTGAQAAILNSQGQKAKTLRRILNQQLLLLIHLTKGRECDHLLRTNSTQNPFKLFFLTLTVAP